MPLGNSVGMAGAVFIFAETKGELGNEQKGDHIKDTLLFRADGSSILGILYSQRVFSRRMGRIWRYKYGKYFKGQYYRMHCCICTAFTASIYFNIAYDHLLQTESGGKILYL